MDEYLVICLIAALSVLLVGFRGQMERKKLRRQAEKLIREEYGTAPGEGSNEKPL